MELPDSVTVRAEAQRSLSCYWTKGAALLSSLPVVLIEPGANPSHPPEVELIKLPEWAAEIGVEGSLLVPSVCLAPEVDSPSESWRMVDWWMAAFYFLNGIPERAAEQAQGPIHSYSYKLDDWSENIWDRAWVNRIALFLRRWAAREQEGNEEELMGACPKGRLLLTHDVDAINKSWTLRCKQTAFYLYNSVRLLLRFRIKSSLEYFYKALRFFVLTPDYRSFEEILEIEKEAGIRGTFNFYAAGLHSWNDWKRRIIDPVYDVSAPDVACHARKIVERGGGIGLHQSWGSWEDSEAMKRERSILEAAAGVRIETCRQHWLMFSWANTWRAQAEAGLLVDTTLGFNDRSGFRNSAALQFQPWNFEEHCRHSLDSLPMILMDSHLYNYSECAGEERRRKIQQLLEEVAFVGGSATVIWHTQVIGDDYGWKAGLLELVSEIKDQFIVRDEPLS